MSSMLGQQEMIIERLAWSSARRKEWPASASSGSTYAPTEMIDDDVPPGAPTEVRAGPELPAELMKMTSCSLTTYFINQSVRLEGYFVSASLNESNDMKMFLIDVDGISDTVYAIMTNQLPQQSLAKIIRVLHRHTYSLYCMTSIPHNWTFAASSVST